MYISLKKIQERTKTVYIYIEKKIYQPKRYIPKAYLHMQTEQQISILIFNDEEKKPYQYQPMNLNEKHNYILTECQLDEQKKNNATKQIYTPKWQPE